MRNLRQNQKGTALIITIIIFFVLMGLSGVLLMNSTSHYKMNRSYKALNIAKYSATGALNTAVFALNKDASIDRIEGQSGNWESIVYHKGGKWYRLADDTEINVSSLSYKVDDLLSKRSNKHFRVKIGSLGASGGFELLSCSSYDGSGFGIKGYIVDKNVQTTGLPGIFGYKKITFRGNGAADSYTIDEDGKEVAGKEAVVGSNEMIDLGGKDITVVMGDVQVGSGGELTKKSSEQVSGKINISAKVHQVPTELDSSWLNTPTMGDFTLEGGPRNSKTYNTEDGVYHYDSFTAKRSVYIKKNTTIYCHDSFSMTANAILYIDEGVTLTLYVNNRVDFKGHFVSTNGAENFKINIIKDDRDNESANGSDILGSSEVKALVYAPWANVNVGGNAGFKGTVTGYRVDIFGAPGDDGAKVHHLIEATNKPATKKVYYLHSTIKGKFEDGP